MSGVNACAAGRTGPAPGAHFGADVATIRAPKKVAEAVRKDVRAGLPALPGPGNIRSDRVPYAGWSTAGIKASQLELPHVNLCIYSVSRKGRPQAC